MTDSDTNSTPDDPGVTIPMRPTPTPGAPSSRPAPTASHYAPELPFAEELQEMLGGAYVVEAFLGQGGMGAVYKGLQMPLRRPVAIKILAKRDAASGEEDAFEFEERFRREAYAMAALSHPNIVQVYDCGDAGEHYLYISMELVEGGDLSDAIKGGQMTPERALKLIPQICDGLQAAHDRGIVHRDIKPANIFLTADGRAKVADFGLAKKFDAQSTFATKTGMAMGTPDYAAPEQFDAVKDIDHRADVYSLGVMMYQMLTGTLPRGSFRPASQRAGTDPRLDAVLVKAMEHERDERYQSVAEIKADVLAITAGPTPAPKPVVTRAVPVATPAPVTRAQPQAAGPRSVAAQAPRQASPPVPGKKGGGVMIAGVLGVLALVGAGAWFVVKPKSAVPPASAGTSVDQGTPADGAPSVSYRSLLDAVQLPQAAVAGNWKRSGSGVEVQQPAGFSILELPYEPPAEYDLEAEFTPSSGGNNVNFHLVAGGSTVIWKVNAHGRTPPIHGLDQLDGKLMNARTEAVVQKAPALQQGQRYSTKVEVRRGGIRAFVNGEEALNWKGDFKRLSTEEKGQLRNPRALGIGSYKRGVTFHTVSVREVSGAGRVTGGAVDAVSGPAATTGAAGSPPPASATKDAPFVNSLGMKFVPVPIVSGPTKGQRVLFCVWETRVIDYQTFVTETGRVWQTKETGMEAEHPAVWVSWDDAKAFCDWLTQRDRKASRIGGDVAYRLPSDLEWSSAVGIGDREREDTNPHGRDQRIVGVYPWGTAWPPPENAGNYWSEEALPEEPYDTKERLTGRRDGFGRLAPVGRYPASIAGLHDLGGNVWEWCEDWFNEQRPGRVLRGGNFGLASRSYLLSSRRNVNRTSMTRADFGFRVVLAAAAIPGNAPAPSAAAPKDPAFVNSLNMKFVAVPGTEVLMCIHETRRRDYAAYAAAVPGVDGTWKAPVVEKQPLKQTDDDPVVQVSWDDAHAFCEWLSKKEGRAYRLPTEREWNLAVATGVEDPAGITDDALRKVVGGQFPWGTTYNEADAVKSGNYEPNDGFAGTAPVMSFQPNGLGIYDLGGNAWEWEEGNFSAEANLRALRGCGYRNYGGYRKSGVRERAPQDMRMAPDGDYTRRVPGFRVVVRAETAAAKAPAPAAGMPPLPGSGALSTGPGQATKEAPFVNSLNMKFVPVPITGGPTGGKRVLFSIWETRVQDYAEFSKEKQGKVGGTVKFTQGPTHPVVGVSWENADAYCAWLTARERSAGKIGARERYRLPSDLEWSCALGIGDREDASRSPSERNDIPSAMYLWGSAWPPPHGTGNLGGVELPVAKYSNLTKEVLSGYRDEFTETAPTGSYAANASGLHDLVGNAFEWCADEFKPGSGARVARGGAWASATRFYLAVNRRLSSPAGYQDVTRGFRCVLDEE